MENKKTNVKKGRKDLWASFLYWCEEEEKIKPRVAGTNGNSGFCRIDKGILRFLHSYHVKDHGLAVQVNAILRAFVLKYENEIIDAAPKGLF